MPGTIHSTKCMPSVFQSVLYMLTRNPHNSPTPELSSPLSDGETEVHRSSHCSSCVRRSAQLISYTGVGIKGASDLWAQDKSSVDMTCTIADGEKVCLEQTGITWANVWFLGIKLTIQTTSGASCCVLLRTTEGISGSNQPT